MALVRESIPRERKSSIQDNSVAISWDVVENGIAEIVSDTTERGTGQNADFYVKKLGGNSLETDLSASVTGRCKGRYGYVDPDIEGVSRYHLVYAYNNSFYVRRGTNVYFLRNVDTSDSNSIDRAYGEQMGRFLYFAINDEGASAKGYRYDGNITASVAVTQSGGDLNFKFTSIVPNTNNGLVVGNSVIVTGTTDYDGTYLVKTVVDATNVTVDGTYTSAQSGTCEMYTMKYVDMTQQDAARMYGYMDDSLVAIGIGKNSKNVQVSQNDVGGEITDFTVSSNYGEGFSIFGIKSEITAHAFLLGYLVLSEPNRITFHKRKVSAYSGSTGVEQQETRTIEDSLTVSGMGSQSPDGLAVGEDNTLYIMDDDAKAIWAYRVGVRSSKKKISDSFTPTLENFYMRKGFLLIDKSTGYLSAWVSSVEGGFPDTILIYNPRTDSWGVDKGKQLSDPVYNPIDKEVYAFGISSPGIYKVWDETHSNDGIKIKMKLRSRPINGGDEYAQKEYDSSSIKVAALVESQSFTTRYFIDEDTSPDLEETKTFSDLPAQGASLAATWGQYVSGSGGGIRESDMTFRRYLNEDAISDFSRITIEIEEESFAPFFVYKPKLVIIPTEDQSDDF